MARTNLRQQGDSVTMIHIKQNDNHARRPAVSTVGV